MGEREQVVINRDIELFKVVVESVGLNTEHVVGPSIFIFSHIAVS